MRMSDMYSFPFSLRSSLAVLLASAILSACGNKESPDASASAPADAASTAVDAPSAGTVVDVAAGAKLYESVCATCHAEGVGKAPRLGKREDWEARISQGEDALTQSVINGKGIMPAKGTAMDATEPELRAAVRYMRESVAVPAADE